MALRAGTLEAAPSIPQVTLARRPYLRPGPARRDATRSKNNFYLTCLSPSKSLNMYRVRLTKVSTLTEVSTFTKISTCDNDFPYPSFALNLLTVLAEFMRGP